MRKKGFTLIELLAVIVILSIIALISVPLILNVIDESKKGAFQNSAYGIIESAELEYAQDILKGTKQAVTFTYTDGVETSSVDGRKLNYKGTKPQNGTISINSSGEVAIAIHDGKYCALKGYDESEVTITEKPTEECTLGEPNFFKGYGGTKNDYFNDVIVLNKEYITIGYSNSSDGDLDSLNKGGSDVTIFKHGTNGNVVWKRNFGGSDQDIVYGATLVNDGYVMVGRSFSTNGNLNGLNKGGDDAIIVKYDLDGNVAWNKNFGGSENEIFYDIIAINDGYIAVGNSSSANGDLQGLNKGGDDAIIVKYGLTGNVVWKKNYGGTYADSFSSVVAVSDGYIAVGHSNSTNGDLSGLNKGSADGIIIKYDLSGNLVWKKNYGGSAYDNFSDIIVVSDGYIVVGYSASANGDLQGLNKGGDDGIIVKYDVSGNVVWTKTYGGSGDDSFSSITLVSGGYVAIGKSASNDDNLQDLNKGGDDAVIVKYDGNFNVIWTKTYGGSGADTFSSITTVSDSYVAVGNSNSNDGDLSGLNKGSRDAIIVKVGPDGEYK